MADLLILRGKHRCVLYAKSAQARLGFDLDFGDVQWAHGDAFIVRSVEATNDIKEDFVKRGLDVEEK